MNDKPLPSNAELDELLLAIAPVMTTGVIQPNGIRKDFDSNASKRDRFKADLEALLLSKAEDFDVPYRADELQDLHKKTKAVPVSEIKALCKRGGEDE